MAPAALRGASVNDLPPLQQALSRLVPTSQSSEALSQPNTPQDTLPNAPTCASASSYTLSGTSGTLVQPPPFESPFAVLQRQEQQQQQQRNRRSQFGPASSENAISPDDIAVNVAPRLQGSGSEVSASRISLNSSAAAVTSVDSRLGRSSLRNSHSTTRLEDEEFDITPVLGRGLPRPQSFCFDLQASTDAASSQDVLLTSAPRSQAQPPTGPMGQAAAEKPRPQSATQASTSASEASTHPTSSSSASSPEPPTRVPAAVNYTAEQAEPLAAAGPCPPVTATTPVARGSVEVPASPGRLSDWGAPEAPPEGGPAHLPKRTLKRDEVPSFRSMMVSESLQAEGSAPPEAASVLSLQLHSPRPGGASPRHEPPAQPSGDPAVDFSRIYAPAEERLRQRRSQYLPNGVPASVLYGADGRSLRNPGLPQDSSPPGCATPERNVSVRSADASLTMQKPGSLTLRRVSLSRGSYSGTSTGLLSMDGGPPLLGRASFDMHMLSRLTSASSINPANRTPAPLSPAEEPPEGAPSYVSTAPPAKSDKLPGKGSNASKGEACVVPASAKFALAQGSVFNGHAIVRRESAVILACRRHFRSL